MQGNTLYDYISRPLTKNVDCSLSSVGYLSDRLRSFLKDTEKAYPHVEALIFYGLNHGVSLIREIRDLHEPLDTWERDFINCYYDLSSFEAIRAAYYLFSICLRESRHNKSLKKHKNYVCDMFSEDMYDFFIGSNKSEDVILNKFLDTPPAVTLGDFVKCLQWQFYNCGWGCGFGGAAWGEVSDCLVNFVTGKITAEVMLDTVWTLAHNNGTIFNKPLLYYKADTRLLEVLDIQRSGQIPEAVLYRESLKGASDMLKKLMQELQERFPSKIGISLDLGKIIKANPIGSNWKTELNSLNWNNKLEEESLAKASPPIKGITIMPGLTITKFSR